MTGLQSEADKRLSSELHVMKVLKFVETVKSRCKYLLVCPGLPLTTTLHAKRLAMGEFLAMLRNTSQGINTSEASFKTS